MITCVTLCLLIYSFSESYTFTSNSHEHHSLKEQKEIKGNSLSVVISLVPASTVHL